MTDKPAADAAFTPEQESRIAELLKGVLEGKEKADPPERPPGLSDAQYEALSDREQTRYIDERVREALDTLTTKGKVDELGQKVEQLSKTPEDKPTVVGWLEKFFWGPPKK